MLVYSKFYKIKIKILREKLKVEIKIVNIVHLLANQ